MKLTKITIRNFRGIEELDVDVPPAGFIAKGGNARGKSTILKAVRSALEARDIGADAIRIGASKAELLIDLDAVSVQRAITPKSSTLTVEKDGMRASKPTAYLRELLGSSGLDPLDLYLEKDAKKRRALILSALPCAITREQLAKYTDGRLPPDIDLAGHGLEIVKRAHDYFYGERTEANRKAADDKREAERLSSVAREAASAVSAGPVLPYDDARTALTAAEHEAVEIQALVNAARDAEAKSSDQHARIATLRREADAIVVGTALDLDTLLAAEDRATVVVRELEAKLDEARKALNAAQRETIGARQTNATIERDAARAASLRSQAEALESGLAATTLKAPDADRVIAVATKVTAARATLERATRQAEALKAIEVAEQGKAAAKESAARADALDAIVKRLANEAPAELLAASDGIPGLSVDGDEVRLDGKSLDALSGAEQLKFAVEVARRANGRSKILVVDGLERLDTDQLRAFVQHATRAGWQLIGSLVTGGELVVAAIEPENAAEAAE